MRANPQITTNNKKNGYIQRHFLRAQKSAGFTLMEIVVATTIFASVTVIMLSLFNYTLKINRRGEALRQSSQGIRNFVESLAKEIRNGDIDYGLNASHDSGRGFGLGPCSNGAVNSDYYGNISNGNKSNFLSLINSEGVLVCYYYGDGTSNYIGNNIFSSNSGSLVIHKEGLPAQLLNPPNFKVEELVFLVRPTCDPYTINTNPGNPGSGCDSYLNDYPRIQPMVSMFFKFLVNLPTGEKQAVYYQTSVSSNKYDIPQ